ncbi:PAQR family membrane homeostasis protein TrhA [Desulfococcus multivorans]|uniref:Channel protein, hemolysin III family n=2 Tax=Desulfococcus TaxID=896 RepID=S7TVM9_DESML|nr:hemolysin III family protein [Desulfococcus multivorans]AQU99468.1 hemolysin D [Desulfococcus multivorans]EPR40800.1 channel protein, hemolysin III family [Desulfococcus multivorans DSM 2059]SKA20936.1 hemolysin III [Desulfococcus multivorans DSM 2059]
MKKATTITLSLLNQNIGQSQGEEIANSISHGIGLLGALIGTPFLIMHAVRNGNAGFIFGASVFSASMILLYLASTLYHAWPIGKTKRCFRIIEHSAIFILIAGTYTPLTLGILRGAFGWTLFGVIWGLAAAGVVLKAFYKTAHPILSTCLYLLMGWLLVIAVKPLFAGMPEKGLFLLIAGGLSYTTGVAFFAIDSRVPYGHLIWHLFVLTGTTCHYFLILWYAV